eukprot:CAMPEP_0170542652 /NCGR_PEP_ID=MMETSP0211-20121228/2022_1 /TAXON_ID=311385 /ORGANISM="Pseudokeronopsis sp., Strain OXSARD2" /LENGTH=47 /DNA_ID= /DNA_START= /DNA_END= /DNA_ORIENTATION=
MTLADGTVTAIQTELETLVPNYSWDYLVEVTQGDADCTYTGTVPADV